MKLQLIPLLNFFAETLRETLEESANGQHGIFAAARHHLRLVSTLVKNEIPYLNPGGRTRGATPDQIATAAQATWQCPSRTGRRGNGGCH